MFAMGTTELVLVIFILALPISWLILRKTALKTSPVANRVWNVMLAASVTVFVIALVTLISQYVSEKSLTWEGWVEEKIGGGWQYIGPIRAKDYILFDATLQRGNPSYLWFALVRSPDLEMYRRAFPTIYPGVDLCEDEKPALNTSHLQASCYATLREETDYYIIAVNTFAPDFQGNDAFIKVKVRYR